MREGYSLKTLCGKVNWFTLTSGKIQVYYYDAISYWKDRCYRVEHRMYQLEAEIRRLKTELGR